MKLRSCTIAVLGWIAAAPVPLGAQPFFYNEGKDRKAQLAEAAAKEIANGAVFNTEIQNLDTISKLQIQRIVSFAQVQFTSGINAFGTWKDVSDQMTKVEGQLERPAFALTPGEAAIRIKEVKAKITELEAAIQKLKSVSNGETGTAEEIQAHLDTASSVLTFVEQLPTGNDGFAAAIEHIKTWLDTAKTFYDSFAAAAATRKQLREALAALSSTPEADELRLLRLEIEQLNWIAQNAARAELEVGSVLGLVQDARDKLTKSGLIASTERIETTLARLADEARTAATPELAAATRDRLVFLIMGLHAAAAARTQGGLPRELASLRDTQQEWRYSILRSAARVLSTEQLMLQAATRLSLYYKGGIKPSQIAQLLYNLSGLISLPIIASK